MNHAEILKRVRTIELKMRGMAQHVFAGQYQSAFKGKGMSFSEVRAYQYGDDVRSIDWNVTARFREPFIKVFEEERELAVLLIIDVSGSMYFGMTDHSKLSLAIEILATVGFSAAKKGDKVGVVFVSDKVEQYIAPKKGADHIHFMIRRLLKLEPQSKRTDLTEGIKLMMNLHKQRSICFVLSDFSDPAKLRDPLAKLHKKHDVIGLQLVDEGESQLPKIGFVRWYNAESGTTSWVDTSSSKVRSEISEKQRKLNSEVTALFERLNIDFARCSSGKDPFGTLLDVFRHRR